MNKKTILTLGVMAVFVTCAAAYASEKTIYTDSIGRMHFLGKDPASNVTTNNYANPEQQDLTRKLYNNAESEVNNVDYKVKNYDNTFGFGKLDTQTLWKNKFANKVDATSEEASESYKKIMTTEKGESYGTDSNVTKVSDFKSLDKKDNAETSDVKADQPAKKKKWWKFKK